MILVTGATGQIGTVLTEALRAEYGQDNVLATDIRKPEHPAGLFETLDILNTQLLKELVGQYKVTTIYHHRLPTSHSQGRASILPDRKSVV